MVCATDMKDIAAAYLAWPTDKDPRRDRFINSLRIPTAMTQLSGVGQTWRDPYSAP